MTSTYQFSKTDNLSDQNKLSNILMTDNEIISFARLVDVVVSNIMVT